MATQVQFRGGTTSEHSTFTGVAREVTVDTTKKTVVVHDGSTAGGIPLAKESAVTSAAAITGGSINGTTIGASTASTGAFTTLSASSTVSGAGFSTYLASPPAIGGTTASTGRFTTVTATGLTSGRVTFAGASGLLSDSANLTFDGTKLTSAGLVSTGALNVSGSGWGVLPYVVNSLVVDSNAGETRLFATGTNTSTHGNFLFYTGTTNGTASERMRITSSGNVFVGNTTDPLGGNRLLVQSAATANNNRTFSVYNTAATSTTAFANRLVQISSNGSGADATIHFSDQVANNAYFGMGSGALYFATGGTTERMRIDSSGNLLVGTTTARANAGDIQVSKGISFPATQSAQSDANTLDDYEEGTWTPNQGSCVVVGTFGSAGTYTKIGRLVTVNIAVTGSTSISITAGSAICTNLPFSVLADGIGAYGTGKQDPSSTILTLLAYSTSVFSTLASGAGTGLYMTITYMQS